MDSILLESHAVIKSYYDFSIYIPENNGMGANHTLRRHYWLKDINLNSIETFTFIP